jgi:hypothetical protein
MALLTAATMSLKTLVTSAFKLVNAFKASSLLLRAGNNWGQSKIKHQHKYLFWLP